MPTPPIVQPAVQPALANPGLTEQVYTFVRPVGQDFTVSSEAHCNYLVHELWPFVNQLVEVEQQLEHAARERWITPRECRHTKRNLQRMHHEYLVEFGRRMSSDYGLMCMWELVGSNGVKPSAYTCTTGVTTDTNVPCKWWVYQL